MANSQLKILVINSGSSSIKFELFNMPSECVEASGALSRIGELAGASSRSLLEGGEDAGRAELSLTIGETAREMKQPVPDHAAGLRLIMDTLTDSAHGGLADIAEIGAVGHRVVHGGEAFSEPTLITDEVQHAIEDHVELAPLHNPPNLLGIQVARELLPHAPQVAVFDTAFHQSIPEYAYTYAVPYELYKEHRVRRYGFHGTSHRFVAAQAAEMLGKPQSEVNLITAHLGNGASITAVRRGQSVDTSMGLTPLEGLVMGTRCGDIDPALIAYLARVKGMGVEEIDKLLNKKSGLLGVSGLSNDVRTLLAAEASGDRRAALALAIYCYRIKKYVGSYTAALGQVDALVFTGGVGENAASLRERTLMRMERLGYDLDSEKNGQRERGGRDIAAESSASRILVIPTNEELMIARDAFQVAESTA